MAILTGSPLGVITTMDDLYVDSPPYVYFQDRLAGTQAYLNNPDGDGFYWNLTGSAANPVNEFGCYEGFQLAGNIEMTNVRCDHIGDKAAIQRLNYLDVTFTLKTLFPLAVLKHVLRGGAVTTTSAVSEKMGIGQPNNAISYLVYFPSVYDPNTGDYLAWTAHKAQFVDSWQLSYTYSQPTTLGVTLRCFADSAKPVDQLFATVVRIDPSAIS